MDGNALHLQRGVQITAAVLAAAALSAAVADAAFTLTAAALAAAALAALAAALCGPVAVPFPAATLTARAG